MKIIRTKADVLALKADEHLPSFYVEEIYQQFFGFYMAENEEESLDEFSLPPHACIYHFDKEEDMQMLVDNVGALEYVDVDKVEGKRYFRIGLMQDHQMSIIFLLDGTLPQKAEQWLENEGEKYV